MKLVGIGSYGFLVDPKQLATFKTSQEVDEQLNQLAAGLIEPVERTDKSQHVVDGQSYLKYLGDLKQALEAREQERNDQPQVKTDGNLPVTREDGEVLHLQAKMESEITKRDDIIAKLLKVAKASQVERVGMPQYYRGEMPTVVGPESLALDANSGSLLQVLSGGSTDKVKIFGNAAILRGLVGDEQARLMIDSDYGDGTFDEYVSVLGG